MRERKVKHVLALTRFLSRASGCVAASGDEPLKALGLQEMCPSHYQRCLGRMIMFMTSWFSPPSTEIREVPGSAAISPSAVSARRPRRSWRTLDKT